MPFYFLFPIIIRNFAARNTNYMFTTMRIKLKQTINAGLATALLMLGTPASAQNKIGDFIESKSNNEAMRGAARSMQYYPEGNDFVCVNGKNRYTRALYGGYTDYRIETSDRPIFAIYKKRNYRNIRFVAIVDGKEKMLHETDFCEARYSDASRRYVLKDKSWGQGVIYIDVVAPTETESGVWRFRVDSFAKPVDIKAMVCNIFSTRLKRSGDIGADPWGLFEPAAGDEGLKTFEWAAAGTTFFGIDVAEISKAAQKDLAHTFETTEKRNKEMAARVKFHTPDAHINTLGGALVTAADGDWDGQTWLHGCIGWRMPLAGWRAGYLGDVLGWADRAVKHFDAYAKSQVTDVEPTIPHPSNDPAMNLARAEKKWGTQMYSNGYICRNPERNNQMHHYDMNLNYIDELLWHFCYDADTAYMRKMWPVLKAHLAWEKRNYDPDGDCLYDAYCCIWASDALYYNSGAATHSSAYNYRGNRLAARIAEILGEDPTPYRAEAGRIIDAMNSRLWLNGKGCWAEYEDFMGLKRKHESAALWSVYTPIDCGAGSPEQNYRATEYVDREIPHIPVVADGKDYGSTISTSNWLPYSWSINNVAAAEVMHTALAFFEAGRPESAFRLMKANIMDQMYIGVSPGNFGQISFYDAARGECYRDFGDCIGISSRTLIQGLFGVVPDALNGRCVIRPGFPAAWDSASVETPYIKYSFKRTGGKNIYEITQNFAQPLKIVVRQNLGGGKYRDIVGSDQKHQVITTDIPALTIEKNIKPVQHLVDPAAYGLGEPSAEGKFRQVKMDNMFNSEVDDIYKNKYLTPRSPYTTLQLPTQGIGEWCHPTLDAEVNDSVFRTLVADGEFSMAGVPFRTPAAGHNIAYTSLWDNYPDSITIRLKGKAHHAYLLMAGSTNHMQSRIANAVVTVEYADGTTTTMDLVNPDNWCPIEQDYFIDNKAFYTTSPRPYRVSLGTGKVSRDLGAALNIGGVYGRPIPGGAAQMLKMPLNADKKLRSIKLRTLSNDVVVGLMAVTLQ